ncbi:MAG TPA: hypothetical protein PKA41_18645, partial [Verrucomicrobiota bacterium]|nr:hypothetical protein [Verrucomicrobiota bacterium]
GFGNPPTTYIGDYPAAWHNVSCSLSFADGHVEAHQWLDPRTTYMPIGIPTSAIPSPNNPDMDWLMAHSTAPE